jgi:hypothetical protein
VLVDTAAHNTIRRMEPFMVWCVCLCCSRTVWIEK